MTHTSVRHRHATHVLGLQSWADGWRSCLFSHGEDACKDGKEAYDYRCICSDMYCVILNRQQHSSTETNWYWKLASESTLNTARPAAVKYCSARELGSK